MGSSKKLFWASAALLVYILLFVWLGFYAFPQADDYQFLLKAKEYGFIGAQVYWYTTITSRITNTLLMTTMCMLDNVDLFFSGYRYFHVAWIVFAFCSLLYFVKTVSPKSSCKSLLLFAVFFTALWLDQMPALNEVIYWIPGTPYFLSCVLIVFESALLIRMLSKDTSHGSLITLCVLAFLNGSFSELPAVFQIVLFIAAYVWSLSIGDEYRKRSWKVIAALVCAVAGIAVEFFASGTSARMGGADRSLTEFVRATVMGGIMLSTEALLSPLKYAILLFIPDLFDVLRPIPLPKKLRQKLGIGTAIALTVLAAFAFEAICGYSLMTLLPPRGDAVVHWLIWYCWIIYFIFIADRDIGRKIRSSRAYKYRYVIFVLLFALSFNTRRLIVSLPQASTYHQEHEARHEALKADARSNSDLFAPVFEKRVPLLSFYDITYGSSNWLNPDVAGYYGASSLTGIPHGYYEQGMRREVTDEEMVAYFTKRADEDDVFSQMFLARVYDFGSLGVEFDGDRAIRLYEMASDGGDPEAARALIRICLRDGRYERDYGKGARYIAIYLLRRYVLGTSLGPWF